MKQGSLKECSNIVLKTQHDTLRGGFEGLGLGLRVDSTSPSSQPSCLRGMGKSHGGGRLTTLNDPEPITEGTSRRSLLLARSQYNRWGSQNILVAACAQSLSLQGLQAKDVGLGVLSSASTFLVYEPGIGSLRIITSAWKH